jgi:hypothetical protein
LTSFCAPPGRGPRRRLCCLTNIHLLLSRPAQMQILPSCFPSVLFLLCLPGDDDDAAAVVHSKKFILRPQRARHFHDNADPPILAPFTLLFPPPPASRPPRPSYIGTYLSSSQDTFSPRGPCASKQDRAATEPLHAGNLVMALFQHAGLLLVSGVGRMQRSLSQYERCA